MRNGGSHNGSSGPFNRQAGPALPRVRELRRGDVIWVPVPQTLSSESTLHEIASKIRPFVVLQQKVQLRIDENDCCTTDALLLGVTSTTQEHLVDGRPTVHYIIPANRRDTFALLDSVHTAPVRGVKLVPSYTFSPPERQALADGLDAVLRPEERFFLRDLFNPKKEIMPGQVWTIHLATGDTQNPVKNADALVLFRRGCSYFSENGDSGQRRFTPYLVAVFPNGYRAQDMINLRWEDIALVAVHERSFSYQVGRVTDETVGILVNTLRQRVGVKPIEYSRPLVRHLAAGLARTLIMPFFVKGGLRP